MSEAVIAGTPEFAKPVDRTFWGAMAAIFAASLLLRLNGAGADVSWLTDICSRLIDGEKGWVDLFETTPPIPTLLYMPGAYLARVFGVSADLTVFATTYLACFLALWLADRFAPKAIGGVGPCRWVIIAPAAFFLFILSNGSFAQREHIAAAFSLPMLAIFVRRAEEGGTPPFVDRLVAALAAGFAFAIKPPVFALPFLALGLAELIRARSLRFVFASLLPVSALFGLGLTALSLAAFPQYLGGVTTLMREVYVPVVVDIETVLDRKFFNGAAMALLLAFFFLRGRPRPAAVYYSLAISFGYLAAFLIQRKYFEYHALPAALFAMIALVMALFPRIEKAFASRPRGAGDLALAGFAIGAVSLFYFLGARDILDHRANLEWAAEYDRPTALAISPSIATSFPLAPKIGAQWVDRIHSQWVAHYAKLMIERDDISAADKARYQRYFDMEINRVAELIKSRRPDLIFQVDHEDVQWLNDALLARDPTLFDDYELAARRWPNRILRRKDSVRAPAAR